MLDAAFRAIAEPRRREILSLISESERTSGEIAAHFNVTGPAISQHLGVLEAAGLVTVRQQGTRRLYRARPEGLVELRAFLDEFWDRSLRALAREAEAEERRQTMASSHIESVVEREMRVAARPETVFPFFTDPEKLMRWMGVSAELEPTPGGVFRVNITGRDVAAGAYVAIEPPRRVVFTWGWEGDGSKLAPGASTVAVTLTPDGEGTIVRLRHNGLTAEQAGEHAHGWDHYLERLVTAATGGDPGIDPWTSPEGVAS